MSRRGEDSGQRLRSHARGAPVVMFPHKVDAGYRTTQLVTTDRPHRGPPPARRLVQGSLCVLRRSRSKLFWSLRNHGQIRH